MTFAMVNTFTIKADGHIERRQVEVPAIVSPAPITVRIVDGTDKYEALRLLRRFTDELEAMP
ncbi:MAG: hypothetical protein AB7F09_15830 [Parvibaculaceae bacterium]